MATKNTKKHGIGWLNVPGYIPQTWNPIVGCSKVSEGCRNCYAERMAFRLAMMALKNPVAPLESYRAAICNCKWTGQTYLVNEALQKPMGWKKPRAIFVNSMGDLFHENTPYEWIDRVFAVMALCPQHLFIVLTKRAERMERYFSDEANQTKKLMFKKIPLPNVWMGVTAENQAAADERIPHLQNTPAAVRFVSCEPLIDEVDLMYSAFNGTDSFSTMHGIDWIICGGESGPGARTMNPDWARSLRDQSRSSGVPYFFKQWGDSVWNKPQFSAPDAGWASNAKHGGDNLDGRQWHEWPEINK